MIDTKNCLVKFESKEASDNAYIYSLPALEKQGFKNLKRLPVSIRIVLESVLRNQAKGLSFDKDIDNLASYDAKNVGDFEIPFVVSRVVLQDLTGVPLLVDLAAMRSEAERRGKNPALIEPLVPVDLVIDHSVQMDFYGDESAYAKNLEIEFIRNRERYEFLKWGKQAFKSFSVVPPSTGIIHQVNLEYLAKLVFSEKDGDKEVFYPDTLVGTDSHTTMINGLGIVGWGVGGIEAEASMLGQPLYFKVPEVIGVCLEGELPSHSNATDLALYVTELLRAEKVVGKFVEFFGKGAENLSLADRATVSNMAPEYGATMGYFPVDDRTLEYMRLAGRDESLINKIKDYYKAQELYGIPQEGDCDYTKVLKIDLSRIKPSISGPRRPQDRIELASVKKSFEENFGSDNKKIETSKGKIGNASVLIASITSCTNTSNPYVMLAAGIVAKKACELGIKPPAYVKTTLAPGSRVVTDYLNEAGLQTYLDKIGFNLAGYGCATCIGNSGPIDSELSDVVKNNNLVCASVLSGNRNFEARVHPILKANYLMSPPLVVIYALAGRVDIDLESEVIAQVNGKDIFLKDLMPSAKEVNEYMQKSLKREFFVQQYSNLEGSKEWQNVKSPEGSVYAWNLKSTYIQEPPLFEAKSEQAKSLNNLRALAIFGDSVTTDHISPAGSIATNSAAAKHLQERNVATKDFNSYGSRRGNDKIMTRGTFANIRIKNKISAPLEGGYTKLNGEGEDVLIYDASVEYRKNNTGLIVFAGNDYGMGSSRDWAAKGTALLGVRAVVAQSFERIHRSNLVGMGVLPFVFDNNNSADKLNLTGKEKFSIEGLENGIVPAMKAKLKIERENGATDYADLILRIDTPIEVKYYESNGILPFVLDKILK